MSTGQARYREVCRTETLPLFGQDWWLDVVAGEDAWDAALVMRGGEVHAALPCMVQRRFGLTALGMPALTRSLGPWLRDTGGSMDTRLGRETELVGELIAGLPRAVVHRFALHPPAANPLPWLWQGYRVAPRVTYVVEGLADESALWHGLSPYTRGNIRRAQDRHGLSVTRGEDLQEFLALHRQVFARQGMALPYPETLIMRLDAACAARDARDIWFARDAAGRAHAAAYVVRDVKTAYYLMGGSDPATRSNGAMPLAMWRAMTQAALHVDRFDFEGSMIPAIERFFRGFGGRQEMYFEVERSQNPLFDAMLGLRRLLRGR